MAWERKTFTSGEWETLAHTIDYRTERPNTMLIERIMWDATTDPVYLDDGLDGSESPLEIAAPHFVWFRFWLLEENQLVEKYFNALGESLGTRVPICMPLQQNNGRYYADDLLLSLWLSPDSRVTVLGEEAFERAVRERWMTPVEADYAERHIRELTLALAQKRFPPALVRNLQITGLSDA